jgi:hypothetical protein
VYRMEALARPSWGFLALTVLGFSLLPPDSAGAATRWRPVRAHRSAGDVCVVSDDRQYTYVRLDDQTPLEFTVTGPRRVKIVTRYLFAEDDPQEAEYTVRILRDGVSHLEKTVLTKESGKSRRCERGAVGEVRRIYLDVPRGAHAYQVFVVGPDRQAAARVYRQVKSGATREVPLTPTAYRSVVNLQFSSGALSSYYAFDAERALRFEVIGPSRVLVCTRLEFDHTMNGSQSYGIEVIQDGLRVRGYRYNVKKMETVCFVEKSDTLPGERKCFTLRVPKGAHAYELRLAGGAAWRAVARVSIPKADLVRKP